MKLTRRLSVALVTSCLSAVGAADPIKFYGLMNVSAQSSDEGESRFTELRSNNSRMGVKGNLKLDSDLEVVYMAEWRVDLTDESGSDNISARNQYMGLKGSFGSVLLGRNDTVLKQSQGEIDLFNHYEADLKGLWQGENRMENSVTYFSPKFKGFTFGASYIAQDNTQGNDAQSFSISYGDKYLNKSQWFAAVAADIDMKGYDTQRVSVQTKFDNLKLGMILHNQKLIATGKSEDGALVSAAYSIGKIVVKVQYQVAGNDDSASVGADYALGQSTKAFLWFTNRNLQDSADSSWLAAGLEHKF
ncbi:porin [Paraglaciecola arctica]|uniref:porin n=1 Tax=Paraglaciecola arctica TaxID=1128911 RepID=UPI001C072E26|nr:porin [Paraglaciecola arctica]MBU3004127.1 porin [Paraglaciecola arctica]